MATTNSGKILTEQDQQRMLLNSKGPRDSGLPHVRPPEDYQRDGRRSGLLIVYCSVHLDNSWIADPNRDESAQDAVVGALSHFVVDRQQDWGLCNPSVAVGSDWHLAAKHMWEFAPEAAAADKAAEAEAAEAASTESAEAAAAENGGKGRWRNRRRQRARQRRSRRAPMKSLSRSASCWISRATKILAGCQS